MNNFVEFINKTFNNDVIKFQKFKSGLWLIDVDCFPKESYKLTIAISNSEIQVSTIAKKPMLNFS